MKEIGRNTRSQATSHGTQRSGAALPRHNILEKDPVPLRAGRPPQRRPSSRPRDTSLHVLRTHTLVPELLALRNLEITRFDPQISNMSSEAEPPSPPRSLRVESSLAGPAALLSSRVLVDGEEAMQMRGERLLGEVARSAQGRLSAPSARLTLVRRSSEGLG